MELKLLKKEKDSLEFKLIGERHTLPALLKKQLLKDSSVEFASYKLEHPFDEDSLFFLRTKGKKPEKALQDASDALKKELKSFESKAKKM